MRLIFCVACEIEFKWKSDNEKVIESASDFVKELVNDTGSSLKQNCIEDDVFSVVIETECKNFGEKMLSVAKDLNPPVPYSTIRRYKN